ncbi:zinc finger MYM-type protein 1-like [Salvia hispanica]|uniref:zinc finger MYM-type protein 1-like n=1 Tax=Salvia hispanica TaxID=49212 RepID=UPI0020093249|nr:zinc finger MYM-type protein 1-like [Salvia hispanica]
MEKYFKKRTRNSIDSSSANVEVEQEANVEAEQEPQYSENNVVVDRNPDEVEIDEKEIDVDPGSRRPIDTFDVNIRDRIRREYVAKGPCQPKGLDFPRKKYGKDYRGFRDVWYKDYVWLEYSTSEDAAYCFWCFLFKRGYSAPGDETFVSSGFSNWKKANERFRAHIGSATSSHNKSRIEYENFVNQRQSVSYVVRKASTRQEKEYRIRLTATLDVIRFLLNQGLAFRGDDESSTSINRGNFLEMLHWYSLRNDEVGQVVLKNAPGNNQMISPKIQKEMVNACAVETTLEILGELGEGLFSIMVDESRDCSVKEQMAIVIRYVNKNGEIIERFLSLVHVKETTSRCLKEAIDFVFSKLGLSLSRLRGQGYDGASNMRGEFNGLKALILKENPSAWYVHCFAHQLQLVCVAVCKANRHVSDFFGYLTPIVTACGSSCKRADKLRQNEHDRMVEMIEKGEINSGKGLNQETSLHRPGDTRWGSHYTTVIRLVSMWPSVVKVLESIFSDGDDAEQSGKCKGLLQKMESYDFVFIMILMKHLLCMVEPLSYALQDREQNILNAINMIAGLKEELQTFRESGWDDLLQEVEDFCRVNEIDVTNMDDIVPRRIRMKRDGTVVTNYHYYRVEIFCQVVDSIIQEMRNRFSESSTDLLNCMACLDPRNQFSNFNVDKLVHLATLYPKDFSSTEMTILPHQLKSFLIDARRDTRFSDVEDLGTLSKKIVEMMKDGFFPLVYRLIKLVLLLPVATASVERVFSAMKFVKSVLRNRMGDDWLNDIMVVYNERKMFTTVSNERILWLYAVAIRGDLRAAGLHSRCAAFSKAARPETWGHAISVPESMMNSLLRLSGQGARMFRPGAIKSGFRIPGVSGFGSQVENAATI